MNTLDTLQTRMQRELDELHHRSKRWPRVFSERRQVVEQHLGQWCYLAEEFLTEADLMTLKELLGLDNRQWSAYKWTFLHTAAAY